MCVSRGERAGAELEVEDLVCRCAQAGGCISWCRSMQKVVARSSVRTGRAIASARSSWTGLVGEVVRRAENR